MKKIALVAAAITTATDAAACAFCATELSQQVRLDVMANFWTNIGVAILPFAVTGVLLGVGYALAARRAPKE